MNPSWPTRAAFAWMCKDSTWWCRLKLAPSVMGVAAAAWNTVGKTKRRFSDVCRKSFFLFPKLVQPCLPAENQTTCQEHLSFVCERHNITMVEINPLEPQPGGLPCGNNSLSFRNKVWLLVCSTRCAWNQYMSFLSTACPHEVVNAMKADSIHFMSTSHAHSLCNFLQDFCWKYDYIHLSSPQCYTVLSGIKPLPYKYAKEKCQSVRGSLVTISDQVEQGGACICTLYWNSGELEGYALKLWFMCVLDFLNTLLPSMRNVDRIWIGLKLTHEKSEWIDQSPVNYVNFNPLLVGMHRFVKINVSSPPNCWKLHHSIITYPSFCFPPLIWVPEIDGRSIPPLPPGSLQHFNMCVNSCIMISDGHWTLVSGNLAQMLILRVI